MHRIGYDAYSLFNNFTGPGNYSRTLLRNLGEYYPDNAYFLYTPRVVKNDETHFFLNSPLYSVHLPRLTPSLFWRRLGIPREASRHKIDLFHGLNQDLPVGLSRRQVRTVVTVHDLAFKRYPEFYSFSRRLSIDYRLSAACRQADHILAISRHTKKDLLRYYEVDPDRVTVVYQSVNPRYMQEKPPKTLRAVQYRYQLPDSFFLYVGTVSQRKNLLTAVQALEVLPEEYRRPLVIVGRPTPYKERVWAYAESHGLTSLLLHIRPEFEDLPAIYQQATLLLYPSLYEGFGIPILEAHFSRIPVITSDASSLPEAGGNAALLVDPRSPSEMAHAIERVLTDDGLKEKMIERGFQHAEKFLGEPLTRQLAGVYENLLGRDIPHTS